jgi:hypothetical protein
MKCECGKCMYCMGIRNTCIHCYVICIVIQVTVLAHSSLLQKATATRMSSTFRLGLMVTPRLWDSLWGVLLQDQWSVLGGLISSTCDRVTKMLHR